MPLCTHLLIPISLYLLVGRSPSPPLRKADPRIAWNAMSARRKHPGLRPTMTALRGEFRLRRNYASSSLRGPCYEFSISCTTTQYLTGIAEFCIRLHCKNVAPPSRRRSQGRLAALAQARCRRYEGYKYGSNERAAGTDQAPWSCPHACAIRLARRWRHFDKSCWDQKDRPTPRRK